MCLYTHTYVHSNQPTGGSDLELDCISYKEMVSPRALVDSQPTSNKAVYMLRTSCGVNSRGYCHIFCNELGEGPVGCASLAFEATSANEPAYYRDVRWTCSSKTNKKMSWPLNSSNACMRFTLQFKGVPSERRFLGPPKFNIPTDFKVGLLDRNVSIKFPTKYFKENLPNLFLEFYS